MDWRTKDVSSALSSVSATLRVGMSNIQERLAQWNAEAVAAKAERCRLLEREWSLFEAARERFKRLVASALKEYEPQIAQIDIDKALWGGHNTVASTLQKELRHIVDVLTPIMQSSRFPLSTDDKRLKAEMEHEWISAQAWFHYKAFGHLDLPHRFGFHKSDGLLDYEPVTQGRDQYGQHCYIGDWSNHVYYQRPHLIT